MSDEKTTRRGFLSAAAAAPVGAAALVAAPEDAQAEERPTGETRIQDTPHTRAYLASTRF